MGKLVKVKKTESVVNVDDLVARLKKQLRKKRQTERLLRKDVANYIKMWANRGRLLDGNERSIADYVQRIQSLSLQLDAATEGARKGTLAEAENTELKKQVHQLQMTQQVVTGIMKKPKLAKIARGTGAPPRHAATGRRRVFFAGRDFVETRTYARAALLAGNRIAGPALIEEHASTTVLMPGDRLEVDAYGNLAITVGKGGR